MKQKLLNSFTWRGTLLVALLCCAFSSAWGQEKKEIVFNAQQTSWGLSTNDNITWTTNTDGAQKFNNNLGIGGGGSGKNDRASYVKLSTSDVLGTITKIVVTASRSENNPTISVTVGGNTFDNDQVVNSSSNNAYTFSGTAYCENNELLINIHRDEKTKGIIYVKSVTVTYIPKATFSISAQCALDSKYYGTYSNDDWAFVVPDDPDDVTVSKVSVSGGILSVISLSKSKIVPKSTGVLVSSKSAGTKSVFVSEKTATADVSGNMLQPSSEPMSGTDSYFYHLTFDENNPLGFYWGAEGGAAWNFSGTNKAYLKVLKTYSGYSAVKGFTLSDSADGIKAIETEKNSEMVFNLAGQRVSKMQKGIYVVNGKKILVK